MKQTSFDPTTGKLLTGPHKLDFGDGTGALCVKETAHPEGECIWSKSAWGELYNQLNNKPVTHRLG